MATNTSKTTKGSPDKETHKSEKLKALELAVTSIEKQFGKDYVETHVYKTASKNAQEAHEAIRPTDPGQERAGKMPDEERVYELIRTRTIASQMASARIMRANVTVEANTDIPNFTANGSRVPSAEGVV